MVWRGRECTPKTPCRETTDADAEAETRRNADVALIQETVTVNASDSVPEPQPIATDNCRDCANLSVEMKKLAEPMAQSA